MLSFYFITPLYRHTGRYFFKFQLSYANEYLIVFFFFFFVIILKLGLIIIIAYYSVKTCIYINRSTGDGWCFEGTVEQVEWSNPHLQKG